MYKNNFVVSIKTADKYVREEGDHFNIPFGSEYIIYLKNLNDVDAAVAVSIDGMSIFPQKIMVRAKQSVELKGNADNHAFKFIQKSQKISQYRGDRPEDGLISVTYQFVNRSRQDDVSKILDEIEKLKRTKPYQPYYVPYWPPYRWTYHPDWYHHSAPYCGSGLNNISSYCSNSSPNFQASSYSAARGADVSSGITTSGSDVNQHYDTFFQALNTDTHTITIKLYGEVQGTPVETVVHTRTKLMCGVCGTRNVSNHKYCGECGTRLIT